VSKTEITFEEVESLQRRMREINAIPFEEITWTRDGKPLAITPKEAEAWNFIGMNNTSFVEFYGTPELIA
jgi:hypothetical protein